MSERGKLFLVVSALTLVVAVAVGGCSQQGPASEPATEKAQEKTESRNDTITAAIDRAEAGLSRLTTVAAAADEAVPGLGASAQLQQLERQLTDASNQAGQARIDAIQNVSASVTQFIKKVDDAAAQAPAGSRKQEVLTTLSARLKAVQADLAAAISASSETTSTGSSETTSGSSEVTSATP